MYMYSTSNTYHRICTTKRKISGTNSEPLFALASSHWEMVRRSPKPPHVHLVLTHGMQQGWIENRNYHLARVSIIRVTRRRNFATHHGVVMIQGVVNILPCVNVPAYFTVIITGPRINTIIRNVSKLKPTEFPSGIGGLAFEASRRALSSPIKGQTFGS